MQNWGRKEHKFENYTNLMLVVGSLSSFAWFYYKWTWLLVFIPCWIIATTMIHFIARIFHLLEKWAYRGR